MSNMGFTTAIQSAMLKTLATAHHIRLIYLFGSQAQDQAGPMSDYDLAILFSDKPSLPERTALAHQLALIFETARVDLVVLNQAPVELQYNVIVTGCLLYEASRANRVEFEAETLSRYGDFLPILRHQREELLQEGVRADETGVQRYRAALRATQDLLAQVGAPQDEGEIRLPSGTLSAGHRGAQSGGGGSSLS
jgi:predicted nucleotidyltransferase